LAWDRDQPFDKRRRRHLVVHQLNRTEVPAAIPVVLLFLLVVGSRFPQG